ncbi:MAG: hypothetical protein V3V33_09705 [Candidatus Lokiarchaeia archaeon]
MAKSSGLAVLALLIAGGALGLGMYQLIFVEGPPGADGQDGVDGIDGVDAVRNTWYDFHYTATYTNPTSTIITVDPLTIDFNVSSGESVYFHFNTWADVDAGANSYIQFNFVLDGVILSGPTYPWWVIRTTSDRIEVPISCQLSLDTVTAGAHNATISIVGSDIDNNIFSSTLFVQTYVP